MTGTRMPLISESRLVTCSNAVYRGGGGLLTFWEVAEHTKGGDGGSPHVVYSRVKLVGWAVPQVLSFVDYFPPRFRTSSRLKRTLDPFIVGRDVVNGFRRSVERCERDAMALL